MAVVAAFSNSSRFCYIQILYRKYVDLDHRSLVFAHLLLV